MEEKSAEFVQILCTHGSAGQFMVANRALGAFDQERTDTTPSSCGVGCSI
jgi:hypothetical protein